ncbi:hypothetical protein LXL04_008222 [Taraxacum kok-saghyz]
MVNQRGPISPVAYAEKSKNKKSIKEQSSETSDEDYEEKDLMVNNPKKYFKRNFNKPGLKFSGCKKSDCRSWSQEKKDSE